MGYMQNFLPTQKGISEHHVRSPRHRAGMMATASLNVLLSTGTISPPLLVSVCWRRESSDHMALSQNVQQPLKWDHLPPQPCPLSTVLMRTEAEIITVCLNKVNLEIPAFKTQI